MSATGFSRRTFLKSVGAAGALVLSVGQLGPYVLGQKTALLGLAVPVQTFFGEAAEKSLRLAISQINAGKDILGKDIPKGLLGNPLDLTVSDSAGRGDQALRAVQELVLSKRADFLMGFFFSEELLGALPAIPVLRKIFMGTGAATPVATIQVSSDYNNFKYFFRPGPSNSFFILQALAVFIRDFLEKKQAWNSLVLFAEDAAWNKAITDGMPAILKAFGSKVEVAKVIRFAEDTADFTPIYKDAVEAMKGKKGGLLTTLAHTGIRPTIQWWDQKV
ncbi:MAG: ABC transporter substrate-binding protein, partial [Nitrospirae bacterium]|nr:ABC transporter substrate-binding protein [Nitrospirota bacterium]